MELWPQLIGDRDLLYPLWPTEYVPSDDGKRIQSPRLQVEIKGRKVNNVLNCDSQNGKSICCFHLSQGKDMAIIWTVSAGSSFIHQGSSFLAK
jgi:hypothetical protein